MEKMYKRYPYFSSLQELCLETICDKIMVHIEPVDEEHEKTSVRKSPAKNPARYRFRNPEVCLTNELSENLMAKMIEKKLLCDATMFLFNSKNTMLKNVRLQNCKVGEVGLQVLKQHNISKLEYSNSAVNRANTDKILGSLNEWTIANMTHANFCAVIDINSTYKNSLVVNIPNMKNLRSLNLSCTKLNQISLWIICSRLKLLEKLDISNTPLEDLSPLVWLADRLISLSVRDLFTAQFYSQTIRYLNKLRYLDVSIHEKTLNPDDTSMSNIPLYDVLADTHSLPELVSLDISGWRNFVPNTTITDYVAAHPKLRYLGCFLNDISSDISLRNVAPPGLVISGLDDEQQLEVALVMYRDRYNYAQHALWHLRQLIRSVPEPPQYTFDLVLSVMAAHPKQFSVQLYATDCLRLTGSKMTEKINSQALSVAFDLILNAMECFPDKLELQRISIWMFAHNYHILEKKNFDHFRCAKLVLDALCRFGDQNIESMASFICSVLMNNASSIETPKLGSHPNYMRKLLAIIRKRVYFRVSDETLQHTVEILCAMVSSNTAAYTAFLVLGGAELLLNVLETFKGNSMLEYRVLTVLLVVIEILEPRRRDIVDSLMDKIFVLLNSENFNLSFLASSIVSHYVATHGYEKWNLASHSRDEMLRELEDTVRRWKAPADHNGREALPGSLRFLLSLLRRTDMDFQLQLWAAWSMHYYCTINPKGFYSLLQYENGHQHLRELIQSSECDPKIKTISSLILETVAQHAVR